MDKIPTDSSNSLTKQQAPIDTNRWAYIKPNIDLTKNIWNVSQRTAAKVALFVPALIVFLGEVFLKTSAILLIDLFRLIGNKLYCCKPARQQSSTKPIPSDVPPAKKEGEVKPKGKTGQLESTPVTSLLLDTKPPDLLLDTKPPESVNRAI
jgi:hypothetical protein